MIDDGSEVSTVIEKHPVKQFVEDIVFNIKWLLPLFYLALVVVMFQLFYAFGLEIWHSVRSTTYNVEHMKVQALDFVDTVMIANLIKMIITGSYNSFICKDHGYVNERISSGMLKIKIMTSIIVVAAIGLLREFVTKTVDIGEMSGHLAIFAAFLIGAIVLSVIEYLHIKGEKLEHEIH